MSGKRQGSRSKLRRDLSVSGLPIRSQIARDRALHVLAAMRRDSKLSLTHTAKLQGIKPSTVRKYFPSDFTRSKGKFRITKSDRHKATLYIIDIHGNYVPIQTRSSKERAQAGRHKRDLNRHLRGDRDALTAWHGKKIAGVEVLSDPQTVKAIEPALPDFSLYRTFNGGVA